MAAPEKYANRIGSVYYGLRKGSFTGRQNKEHKGRRRIPTFDQALEMATAIELQKAIAHLKKSPHSHSYTQQRVERMKQRLAELDEQGKDTP